MTYKPLNLALFCLCMLLLFLLCLISSPCSQAGWKETLARVDQLLAEGKKVAYVMVDLQENYFGTFAPAEISRVFPAQARVIMSIKDAENLHIIDVHSEIAGETLSAFRKVVRTNKYYKLFVKGQSTWSAFKEVSLPPGHEDMEYAITGKLGQYLRDQGIKDIVVTGCFSGNCVAETAEGALKEGFIVHADRQMNFVINQRFLEQQNVSPRILEQQAETFWKRLNTDYKDSFHDIVKESSEKVCALPE